MMRMSTTSRMRFIPSSLHPFGNAAVLRADVGTRLRHHAVRAGDYPRVCQECEGTSENDDEYDRPHRRDSAPIPTDRQSRTLSSLSAPTSAFNMPPAAQGMLR